MTDGVPRERVDEWRARDAHLAHRITNPHWLKFDDARRIIGCQCGFAADEEEGGWGDSVLDHIEDAVRAEAAAEVEALRTDRSEAERVRERRALAAHIEAHARHGNGCNVCVGLRWAAEIVTRYLDTGQRIGPAPTTGGGQA